ncbi:MAG: porphobilinogen synthase [Polyangiales bacterium]
MLTPLGHYPDKRMRRRRMRPFLRQLTRENQLHVSDLIWPLFVQEGTQLCTPVPSLPGVARLSIDHLCIQAKAAWAAGIPAVALFPVVPADKKSEDGCEALHSDNLACRAVRALKQALPGLGVICDVALDPYTIHGHDGLLRDGEVDNDATVAKLCDQAVVLAGAGCDVVAPSDMMDGRVGAIRRALDTAGHPHIPILAYAAKYASAFYGPFRDAVASSSALGAASKASYQMDPAASDEALHEVALDLSEGADMVMVKPAQPYLDIIQRVKQRYAVPTFAYQVSGEYAMLRAAADAGLLDWQRTLMESLIGMRRAGADAILTYAALEVAGWLNASSLSELA